MPDETLTPAQRVEQEPDFVNLKRFQYSLKAVVTRYPDGVEDKVIAAALCIPEAEVEARYQRIVGKLRERLGVLL